MLASCRFLTTDNIFGIMDLDDGYCFLLEGRRSFPVAVVVVRVRASCDLGVAPLRRCLDRVEQTVVTVVAVLLLL